ncbi:MAG: exodeoxyribonuclease VII small subunit [Legionellaceae bacterium]|nr:exodeoxyribonuclease VII small subunit [Legionellaceae bacterium]
MSKVHNFEKTLEELQHIVKQLELGDLPLEEALQQFEKGVHLANHGQQLLREATLKVESLGASPEGEPLV